MTDFKQYRVHERRSHRGRLDRIRRPLLCIILLTFASIPALIPNTGYDVWAHIAGGEWIVENRAVPTTDPFSWDGEQKTWVAYYWTFSLLVYLVYQNLGLVGVIYLKLALAWLITFLLFRLIRRTVCRLDLAVGLSCIALVAMYPMLAFPRSWLVSVTFFILVLDALLQVRRHGNLLAVWWLPFVFVLWANSHIQFVYGLWAVGLLVVEPIIDRVVGRSPDESTTDVVAKVRPRLCLLGACFLATFLNAYGVSLYGVLLNYGKESHLLDVVIEFRSLGFRLLSDWFMLAIAFAACFVLGWQRRFSTFHYMLFATATYFSFHSTRDMWMLSIVGISIVADFDWSKIVSTRPADSITYDVPSILAALMLAGGLLLTSTGLEPTLDAKISETFPEKASAFIQQEQLEGPLFSTYDWGGYLIWRLPDLPVLIDGRAHVHGLAAVDSNVKLWRGKRDWKSDSDLDRTKLIVAPVKLPLFALLRTDPRFQLVYEDDVAGVFVGVR